MRRSAILAAAMLAAAATPALANDPAHPTVVELYQSQGCSSCPPAIANVNVLADRPDVLPLIFAVTYWDQLGWKDTFARPEFTKRQYAFASAGGRDGVVTPQTIVNGRVVTNGGDRAQLIAAIRAADRGAGGPSITAAGGKILIGRGTAVRPATVWLVRYDPRPLRVAIRAGENDGRAISVTASPAPEPQLRSAILVQAGTGGPIIAAAKL